MVAGWTDLLGYAASGLTLATFVQRTMLPMRILAIGTNGCLIGYRALGRYMPEPDDSRGAPLPGVGRAALRSRARFVRGVVRCLDPWAGNDHAV
jgi:hypothetical protein